MLGLPPAPSNPPTDRQVNFHELPKEDEEFHDAEEGEHPEEDTATPTREVNQSKQSPTQMSST